MVEILWKQWDARNQQLHHNTDQHDRSQVAQTIRNHYTNPRHLYPPHTHKYFTPMDDLLAKPLSNQRQWLQAIELYTTIDPRQLDKQFRSRRRLMNSLGFTIDLHRTDTHTNANPTLMRELQTMVQQVSSCRRTQQAR